MKIIIVESPTKARTISKILKIKTVATYGHLKDLPQKSFGIYFENGVFKGKYVFINRQKRNWFMKIKDLLEKAEEVYLATDPDREGEAIAYEIYEELKNKNIFRIRFHEITLKALREALKNKDKINKDLVFAQKARRFLDRIIGYSLSPILWKAFKKNNLSAGRVQTAALYILIQREREIRNFKEKTYYHLKITIETKIGPRIVYLCEENKLKKIEENEKEDFENLLKNSKEIIFEKEKVNEKLIYPNPPLDTELMQRLAQKNLNFPPKKTMLLAQNLFEMGYITYHRTDSHYINKDFQLNLINFIKENYGHQYSWKPKLKKSKLSFEAHEAIRPTSLKAPDFSGLEQTSHGLSGLEKDLKRLWDLIFYYTVLSHMAPAKIRERFLFFKLGNLNFIGEERKVIFDGFLKLSPRKLETDSWPLFTQGEKLKILKFELEERKTEPPKRYTEAGLIYMLKKLGIGRPSTFVPTVETLKKRKYVIKEKNYLKPTFLGEKVVEFLEKNKSKILDLNFTSLIEEKLDLIAKGSLDFNQFLKPFWEEYR